MDDNFSNLFIPSIDVKLKNLLPKKFIFFQFRYLFFQKLGWDVKEFRYLIEQISKKFDFILFSSDIEINPTSILIISLSSIFITIIVSIFPAIKASQLDPVKGLKYE